MVTNILDYAKIKAHKLALNLEPISIKELVENVVDMHKIKAGQKNLFLNIHIDEFMLPPKVFADSPRLTQILTNLVSNALKFTNKGGVSIQVSWFPDSYYARDIVDSDKIMVEEMP